MTRHVSALACAALLALGACASGGRSVPPAAADSATEQKANFHLVEINNVSHRDVEVRWGRGLLHVVRPNTRQLLQVPGDPERAVRLYLQEVGYRRSEQVTVQPRTDGAPTTITFPMRRLNRGN